MNVINLGLSFFLLAGSALMAEPTAAPSSNASDPTAEALPILRANYIGFKELQYKEGDR